MRALVLRLEGPQQSFGGSVLGNDRPTLLAPTQSAVLGLLGAAYGYRWEDIPALVALHQAFWLVTRTDRQGVVLVDFATAHDVPIQAEPRKRKPTVVMRKQYLHDASFAALLVARPGHESEIEPAIEALRYPVFSLGLGRRCCVPSLPIIAEPEMVEGGTWLEMLDQVPSTPGHDGETSKELRHAMKFVEMAQARVSTDLLTGADTPLRTVRVRDVLVGPLDKMYADREVAQVFVRRPAVDPEMAELLWPRYQRPRTLQAILPTTPDTTADWMAP